ncbi:MAG TPA: response regulator, partial [Pyrinomonadaceae bacterium]|nr:response regulator [Pyrinomonadaceae bacterium]
MKKVLPALVIDDDSQVRGVVADILRSEGWSVSEAATAEQAINLLSEQKWVLVVCDVMLDDAN